MHNIFSLYKEFYQHPTLHAIAILINSKKKIKNRTNIYLLKHLSDTINLIRDLKKIKRTFY